MPNATRTIAILTGGGDVPGLNPAIRAITIRALREGYRVIGIRRGWAGLVDYDRANGTDNSESVQELSEAIVNRAGRTGGTFLHTSRTRPSHLPLRVLEVVGRYAGFTALLPAMAGAADRWLIPEYAADVEQLTELMVYDHTRNPSEYSVALVSEAAPLKPHGGMRVESDETDM